MKTKTVFIYLLSVCILFTSCYSYRNIETNKIKVNKKYKFTYQGKTQKAILNEVKDSTLFVTIKGKQVQIPIKEIDDLQYRRFNWWKTFGLVVGITVVSIIGLGFAVLGGSL